MFLFYSLAFDVFAGYLNDAESADSSESRLRDAFCSECSVYNDLIGSSEIKEKFVIFVQCVLKSYLLKMSSTLSEVSTQQTTLPP